MTIFLAGHETTANALTWTWYLLSGAPDAEARLHDEVDRVLRGRLPGVADIPSLPVVERVVTEAMRLYPPAWIVGRRAVEPYAMGPYLAPARSLILASQWVVHRDARFFPDPDRFDPDRWTPVFKTALPPYAYFPFGGGPRRCIGESFAWMELVLVTAVIAQRWTHVSARGDSLPRTKHGMRMTLERRIESSGGNGGHGGNGSTQRNGETEKRTTGTTC